VGAARTGTRGDSRAISVVVSTYEWPEALDVVLRALSEQPGERFEIVVADDGSGQETAEVVERWRHELDLRHVWQSNEGFLKAKLLNRAALATRGDYLVFLDGDCVPRPQVHKGDSTRSTCWMVPR
jgi:glycosyltransferase involved in cell wall biosynthesis